MKTKFSKFERVAGLFVLVAVGGFVGSTVVIAIKRGWFESKVEYTSRFENGDGLYPGMPVQMSGLRAGAVDDVILERDNKVTIRFHVSEKFSDKIRGDSVVRTIRPFIIGDKAVDISIGTVEADQIRPGQMIVSEQSIDIMDILGGRRMNGAMQALTSLADNLKVVLDAFKDPKRSRAIIGVFDKLNPILDDAHAMTQELTQVGRTLNSKKNLQKTLENAIALTGELNRALPPALALFEKSPEMGTHVVQIVENLAALTNELSKVIPALTSIAPDLPRASRRAIEAMDEAVVLLKAMQRSFLMSGNVKDVREEEQKRDELRKKEEKRAPASTEAPKVWPTVAPQDSPKDAPTETPE